jgi:hypothetical protein
MGTAGHGVLGEAVRVPAPSTSPRGAPDFRGLVGEAGWARLPLAVRARFGAHAAAETVVYEGAMAVRATGLARLLAQACRLVGTPLAPWTGEAVPVRVTVRLDGRGLVWDRLYHFDGRTPALVTSRKQVGRDGELLEMARGGLGLRSVVSEEGGALHFRGVGYLWAVAGLRIPLPTVLTPGAAHVVHEDLGGGRFRFTMRFVHPWLGETVFQEGVFEDPEG